MLEHLERRSLFSAYISGPTLHVSGTVGDDVIVFSRSGDKLIADVNGEVSEFALVDFRVLDVSTGAGDDLVVVGKLAVRTMINGGAGNDTLSGGRGGDIIDGGTGSDFILGLGGDDWISPGYDIDIDPSGLGDLDADTLSGGEGSDAVHVPESFDVASTFEATDTDATSGAVFVFGQPRVSFVTREDGKTYARIIQWFSDLGFSMDVMNVRHAGQEIVVSVEARRYRGGAGQATQEYKVVADLGELPEGAYKLRVVDRWGGTISTSRFEAPAEAPQLITPDSISLSTSRIDRVWNVNVGVSFPDTAYQLLTGDVRNRGNKFFLEVIARDKEGSSFSGSSGSARFRLGKLAPGNYSFTITSEGRTVETLNFTV